MERQSNLGHAKPNFLQAEFDKAWPKNHKSVFAFSKLHLSAQ